MRNFYLPLVFATLSAVTASAQFDATITVMRQGAGVPLENALVTLNGDMLATDQAGRAVFHGLQNLPYDFSVTATCYDPGSGTITIAGADAATGIELSLATTNTLLFYIGDPLAILGAVVQVTNGGGFNQSFVTTDTFGGEMMDSVPYGEITYRISAPCYQTLVGTVMVNCNGENGISVIANPVPNTTNNLYFFIGDPTSILGATVQVTNGGDFNQSFVTSDPNGGEVIGNVPYGDISYTITTPCYETVTGTVTVDCNDANGIAVIAELAPATTNNLFFYIGDPMAILGATVEVTNGAGFNQSFVTTDTFGGEMLDSVPYGDISYTITTPCYETVFGSLTVNCNNGEGIMVMANPAPVVIDPAVSFVTGVLTATATGVDYQWVDCANNNAPIDGATDQSFEAVQTGNYAVILSSGDCSVTSTCTAVIVMGVDEYAGRDAFAVYPNPFGDRLTVSTTGKLGPVHMELFSLTGQILLDETRTGMEITLPTTDLPSGSYILRLSSDSSRSTFRVVK